MATKITLITPPDLFQNERDSLLLIDINEEEQDAISKWLGEHEEDIHLNIYFYQGEADLPWLLHALSCSTFVYINVNNMSIVSSYLVSYILSKSKSYFKVDNKNIADIYRYINNNQVQDIKEFLERTISGKR